MATTAERIAAVEAKQKQAGFHDRSEAERFVLMYEAVLALEPASPPTPQSASATMLVEVTPKTDAQKAKAAQIQQDSWTLIEEIGLL